MLFNSVIFIFVFLPISYLVYWALKSKDSRYVWLSLTGYVFYGWWNAKFCLLMLFSTLVSYFAGRFILENPSPRKKKAAMIAAIVVDLSLLGFFKYYNFLADNVGFVSGFLNRQVSLPHFNIILPVGISFYTFHTMSYMIDAYRGTIKPTRNFFEFSCYVSLFSQLVAGPIVRFRQIEDDLENIDRADQFLRIEEGISLFLIGLFKKVLLADSIASFIDPAFQNPGPLGTWGAWLITLGYTYQLYFDFSGYSDMAMGLGHLFGIRIPQNFNSPYQAENISDFWRRWHISLSSWLRDYLYIPLGGNRQSPGRTNFNLMVTMLLGGLWHGANWTFVVWGALHGVLLMAHHQWKKITDLRIPPSVGKTLTFLSVMMGWVYFRSPTLSQANSLIVQMFSFRPGTLPKGTPWLCAFVAVAAVSAHRMPNSVQLCGRRPAAWAGIGFAFLFAFSVWRILANENTPFLYFQF